MEGVVINKIHDSDYLFFFISKKRILLKKKKQEKNKEFTYSKVGEYFSRWTADIPLISM